MISENNIKIACRTASVTLIVLGQLYAIDGLISETLWRIYVAGAITWVAVILALIGFRK